MTTVPLISRLFFYSVAAAAVAGIAMAPKAHAAAIYLQDQSVWGLGRACSGEGAHVGVDLRGASRPWRPSTSPARIRGHLSGTSALNRE